MALKNPGWDFGWDIGKYKYINKYGGMPKKRNKMVPEKWQTLLFFGLPFFGLSFFGQNCKKYVKNSKKNRMNSKKILKIPKKNRTNIK